MDVAYSFALGYSLGALTAFMTTLAHVRRRLREMARPAPPALRVVRPMEAEVWDLSDWPSDEEAKKEQEWAR